MKIGNVATRKKVTARLLFQRVGLPVLDFGNLTLAKQEPKIDRAQQMSFKRGRAQVTHEEPGSIDYRWSVKGDERLGPVLEILNLARESVTYQTQAKDVGTIDGGNDVYLDGWTNIRNFTYTGEQIDEDTPPVLDTDYSVDLVAGVIHLLSDYWFNNDLTFSCTFEVPGQAAKTEVTLDIGAGVLEGEEKKYFLDAYNISNVSIYDSEADADIVEGTDYTVDLKLGIVTLLGYGTPGSLTVTWDQPAIAIKNYVQVSEAFVRGTATLILQDQSENATAIAPKEIATFPAELSTTDWGDNDGKKFNEFQLALVATGAISVKCRES